MSMFCRLPTNSHDFQSQMGIMNNSASSIGAKRKGCTIDNLLEAKKTQNLQQLRNELNSLILKKAEFLKAQKRASLFADIRMINDKSVMNEFADFYEKVSRAQMEDDEKERLELLEECVKESIIIEWPRHFPGVGAGGGGGSAAADVELDFAPLIHRARNVVKCRTSHPTMRVKVCAISKSNQENRECPKIIEAFFRASLVKLTTESSDSSYRQIAGRMILTQREGMPIPKNQEHCGAVVNSEGKLIANQSYKESQVLLFAEKLNEQNVKTTRLKFENNSLCATFPEMGVTLNSMIDRRQLATRYAIQVEVFLNIDNKKICNSVVLSHPFLIAITNDQTEPLLQSIFWHRLVNMDQNEPSDPLPETSTIDWSVLKQAIRAFAKSQFSQARFLTDFEVFHLQTMILLPRVLNCSSDNLQMIEIGIFGDVQTANLTSSEAIRKIRDRLLTEPIADFCQIEKQELMSDKCYSILDMKTILHHTPWLWLYRASEMIQDVGHKLCPSPSVDKKSTKTKKQMAAAEDYQTVLSLFNKGFITFASTHKTAEVFCALSEKSSATMSIRFCDENLGHFSFCYGLSSGKPKIGSISADQIKDFKQGLPEVLLDEHYPSRFSSLLKIGIDEKFDDTSSVAKLEVFNNYKTQRSKMDNVAIMDNETSRVDVLSGSKLTRQSPIPSTNPLDLSTLISGNINFNQSILPLIQTMSTGIDFSTLFKEFFSDQQTEILDEIVEQGSDQDPTNQIAQLLLSQYK